MEPREYILVTYWNWIRCAGVSTHQGYNQSWLQAQDIRHHRPQSLRIGLSHTTHGIRPPDPYGYWYSRWWQVSGRSIFQMPCQHCQLSHRKWSHRLLCIWNAPPRGKSEIAPQRFETMVKAVGRIRLVRELLIFVLYDWAGLGPSSIFCVRDPIRGTKARCPITQPFVHKVLSGLCSLLPFPAGDLRVVASFILSLAALWVVWAPSISVGL